MHRNTDGSRLIGNRSRNRLTNPPCRIGTEFITLAVIEFLNRLDQSQISFLNQIKEKHTASDITFGNADNQSKVCLCQTFSCIQISGFHFLCQLNLFICRQQRNFTDLFQIHTHRIFNADTIRHRKFDIFQFFFRWLVIDIKDNIFIGIRIRQNRDDPILLQIIQNFFRLISIEINILELLIDVTEINLSIFFLSHFHQFVQRLQKLYSFIHCILFFLHIFLHSCKFTSFLPFMSM